MASLVSARCILIVQGGPGTGKTVVGLHRAAWLAFNNADLRQRGLLVVAPNIAFLIYISGVLPSLDASDIHQADLDSLYAGEARVTAVDDPQAARVKGSAQMATVLARALHARIGWSGGPLEAPPWRRTCPGRSRRRDRALATRGGPLLRVVWSAEDFHKLCVAAHAAAVVRRGGPTPTGVAY
jgi:hypothetical protein